MREAIRIASPDFNLGGNARLGQVFGFTKFADDGSPPKDGSVLWLTSFDGETEPGVSTPLFDLFFRSFFSSFLGIGVPDPPGLRNIDGTVEAACVGWIHSSFFRHVLVFCRERKRGSDNALGLAASWPDRDRDGCLRPSHPKHDEKIASR